MVDSAFLFAPTKVSKPATQSLADSNAQSPRGVGQPIWKVALRTLCGCAVLGASACTIVADVDRTKIPGPPPESSPQGSQADGDAGSTPPDASTVNLSDGGASADATIEDSGAPNRPLDAGPTSDASTVEQNDGADTGPDAS